MKGVFECAQLMKNGASFLKFQKDDGDVIESAFFVGSFNQVFACLVKAPIDIFDSFQNFRIIKHRCQPIGADDNIIAVLHFE